MGMFKDRSTSGSPFSGYGIRLIDVLKGVGLVLAFIALILFYFAWESSQPLDEPCMGAPISVECPAPGS